VPELDAERCRMQTYLEQSGVRVIVPEPLPFERAAYMAALEEALTDSLLFVQLLASEALPMAPEDPATDVMLQIETAQRLKKPILQWRDPALDLNAVSDEAHRSRLQANTVERMGIEEFKAFVAKRALVKPAPPTPPRPAQEGSLLSGFVFLDRDPTDHATAKPIVDYLKELKVHCALPLDHGKPEEIRLDLEENLSTCEALIIVYGDVPPGWVRGRFRQSRKIKREQPLARQGIYEGPPSSKEDLNLPTLEVIPCRTGFEPDKLLEFLKQQ
jgi:hypothetical protein